MLNITQMNTDCEWENSSNTGLYLDPRCLPEYILAKNYSGNSKNF